jgi:dinuclear metal center YbgI/SA1388 family protein
MPTLADVIADLDAFAPASLAAEWDNVGLLLGDPAAPLTRVLTCLTVTPTVVAEALALRAELIVSHHPVLFRAVKRLTTQTSEGRLLLPLLRAGVGVYSPHTSFDNTNGGINDQLAERLGLTQVTPLRTVSQPSGRVGTLPTPLSLRALVQVVKTQLRTSAVQVVGAAERTVRTVALACGAAGEFLRDAQRAGADVFLTGELRFHDALTAQADDCAVVVAGHYATERFGIEALAQRLAERFPGVVVSASARETDPLWWA